MLSGAVAALEHADSTSTILHTIHDLIHLRLARHFHHTLSSPRVGSCDAVTRSFEKMCETVESYEFLSSGKLVGSHRRAVARESHQQGRGMYRTNEVNNLG